MSCPPCENLDAGRAACDGLGPRLTAWFVDCLNEHCLGRFGRMESIRAGLAGREGLASGI